MKLDRRNSVLLVLALALVLAELVLPGREQAPRAAGRLLAELDVESVARLRLSNSEGALDLERGADGWILDQKHRFPAHEEVVRELLARLAGVSRRDIVSNTAEARAEFGLGDSATRLVLADEGGRTVGDIWIGQPAGVAQGAYVRLEGEAEIYRAAALPAVPTEPVRWLDTQLMELDPTRVASVSIEHVAAGTRLELTRVADGRWRVPGHSRLLTAEVVDPLLLQSANLYFDDLTDPTTDARGWLRLSFDLSDGGRREVSLGEPQADARFPATNAYWSEAWVVLLSGTNGARLEAAVRRIESALD